MAIYKLIYYTNKSSKKFKKTRYNKFITSERTFYLNQLSADVHNKLFELIPHFKDLTNLNLTVDLQNVRIRSKLNYIYVDIEHLNDVYYLFGTPIYIESIVYSSGKTFIDSSLPLNINRATIEYPKLQVCLNNEHQMYYTFSEKDSLECIIQKSYDYYIEIVRNILSKFDLVKVRKNELLNEFNNLKIIEKERLSKLNRTRRQANNLHKKEKYEWITSKGSDHLKLLYSLNYDEECEKNYVMERVNKELEGWNIDFNKSIIFRKRQIPSKKGMELINEAKKKGFDAEIAVIDNEMSNIKTEAVIINNYLQNYRLYKKVE